MQATTIHRVSPNDKHYLFGFHDLICTDASDTFTCCIGVDDIRYPPVPEQSAGIYTINIKTGVPFYYEDTFAFNYPQGARQQWLGDAPVFVTNHRQGTRLYSALYEVNRKEPLHKLSMPIYVSSKDGKKGYTVNFGRIHRLGGYGYVGAADAFAAEGAPAKDGIFSVDIESGTSVLILSIADVVAKDQLSEQAQHYFTHLFLSPDDEKLLFLHRYILPDGGIMTRLMCLELSTGAYSCLASGFLSHFCWLGNEQVLIFGRSYAGLEKMRQSPLMDKLGGVVQLLKPLARKILKRGGGVGNTFNVVQLDKPGVLQPFAVSEMPVDGHPMQNPQFSHILSNDTYPDPDGFRELYLYDMEKQLKTVLGQWQEPPYQRPVSDQKVHLQGIDELVTQSFKGGEYTHTRSGQHCDFHPRWNSSGDALFFDSLHEGIRGVFLLKYTS